MAVDQVISLHLTARADLGGGPEHVYQLIRHMPETARSLIACPEEPPYRARYEELLGPDNVLTMPHRAVSLQALRSLAREIKARRVDVIHSHGKGAGLYSRLLSIMTGRPCVHTFHGLHIGDYGGAARFAYIMYERLSGHATSAAICVSAGEHEAISAAGLLPGEKLTVIDNGVITPPLRTSEPGGDILQIIAVSRYDHQKNPELLLDIAEALKTRLGPDRFHLSVYGTGERFERCASAVTARSLNGVVTLAGPTTTPREKYREAHVFLSTSRWEGMPMAVLEAMSEGLPVVLSDVVGNRDVIEDGRSGLLFQSENAASAVDALTKVSDQSRRRALGAAARERVEALYSAARMARQTTDLYARVLDRLPPLQI